MWEGPVYEKSYDFSLRILQLCRRVERRGIDRLLANQLFRAGTSIGANVREASAAQSRRDFISKMSIASKEAREALYWLELIRDSGEAENQEIKTLIDLSQELVRLLTSIVKTARST
jgi:four helix bundle protein